MISRLALIALLLIAGVLHIARPELFDPAIPFEPKYAINILAGLLEILLALGLSFSRTKNLAVNLTALWFLVLIPIHVYVSVKGIAMFGISEPLLLWVRTLLQPVLIYWALSLKR